MSDEPLPEKITLILTPEELNALAQTVRLATGIMRAMSEGPQDIDLDELNKVNNKMMKAIS